MKQKMIYVVMANDSTQAVFSDEETADKYVASANANDKAKNPHRLVFYRAYEHELDCAEPFFGERN
jgi:hypothetical protein